MRKNSVDVVNDTTFTPDKELLETVFSWMKEDMIFDINDTCCLKLSNDNYIQALNNKYRGKNAKTDVLTFPCEIKNIPFKGDILIDVSVADTQKGKHTLEKEVTLLFIHGLLHLAGMDHITKKDQTKMSLFEEKYRVRVNLSVP
jgi:probable rRNA maturation factor